MALLLGSYLAQPIIQELIELDTLIMYHNLHLCNYLGEQPRSRGQSKRLSLELVNSVLETDPHEFPWGWVNRLMEVCILEIDGLGPSLEEWSPDGFCWPHLEGLSAQVSIEDTQVYNGAPVPGLLCYQKHLWLKPGLSLQMLQMIHMLFTMYRL